MFRSVGLRERSCQMLPISVVADFDMPVELSILKFSFPSLCYHNLFQQPSPVNIGLMSPNRLGEFAGVLWCLGRGA